MVEYDTLPKELTYGFRSESPLSLDNKIQIPGAERKNSPTGEGLDPGDMPGTGHRDRQRAPLAGSRPSFAEHSASLVRLEAGTVPKRQEFQKAPDGIQRTPSSLLGPTCLGTGLFLCVRRSGHRRRHQARQ